MVQQSIALWVGQYGYPAIFLLLVGGIVGLPVPDQLLLVIAGYLVLTKSLAVLPTLAVAVLGSITGITLSYLLGRYSGTCVSKTRFAAGRLDHARSWFEQYGSWTLIFGYFIPGIRNLIGFTSGMMRLKVRRFAPYAYAGAVVSSVTCVAVGYFFGAQAGWVLTSMGRVAFIAAVGASLFLIRKAMRNGTPDTVKATATATTMTGILK
jgi:membrane protein DedA with SNARE-associated domain